MAPGFFAKLKELGKKIGNGIKKVAEKAWGGIKKGAQLFTQVAPIAQEVAGAVGQMAPGSKLGMGAASISQGLGAMQPLASFIGNS